MSRETNLPGAYNPYKADRQMGARSKAAKATADAFWERTKTSNPSLYQKHLREEAHLMAQQLIFEATLDDPATIAMMNEMSEKLLFQQQNQFPMELALLDVEAGATKREIRNAYRRKARKLHPDAGGDDEAFKQLHAAYRRLLAVAHA